MNAFDIYNFFIESVKYTVDKKLYETCHTGDEEVFHMIPKSQLFLKIVKKIT